MNEAYIKDFKSLYPENSKVESYVYLMKSFIEIYDYVVIIKNASCLFSSSHLFNNKPLTSLFTNKDLKKLLSSGDSINNTKRKATIDFTLNADPQKHFSALLLPGSMLDIEDAFIMLANDISLIREKEKTLRKYQLLNEKFIDSISDGIILFNEDGLIEYANKQFLFLCKYDIEEIKKLSFESLIEKEWELSTIDNEDFLPARLIRKNMDVIAVELRIRSIEAGPGRKYLGLLRSIHLQKNNHSLGFSHERFHIITTYIDAWENWINDDGTVLWVSPAAERITGYNNSECLSMPGFPFVFFEHGGDKSFQEFITKRLKEEDILENVQTKIFCKDKSVKWLSSSWRKVYNAEGDSLGIWASFKDISRQKETEMELSRTVEKLAKLNVELSEAKNIAEQSSKAKESFLANTSHEIRTPLNAIIGMSEALDRTLLSKQQKEFLQVINASSRNLLIIINDILDLSKVESGELEIDETPFSVHDLAQELLEGFHLQCQEKGLRLDLFMDEKLNQSVWLISDPNRIKQILNNLLSNAVKFTNKGKVELSVSLMEKTKNKMKLRFSVKDTGIGIPNEKLNVIFKEFHQANAGISREFGGTGLGLPISKRLVQILGGKLLVASEEAYGSEFSFVLDFPYQKSHTIEKMATTTALSPSLSGIKVLVAEDQPFNQMVIRENLNSLNVYAKLVSNGQQALDELSKGSYDLVLMDIEMPVLDGLEAVGRIRKGYKGIAKDIPVIALTAHAMKSYIKKIKGAGMNDYLIKPFFTSELLEKISIVLGFSTSKDVPAKEMLPTEPSTELFKLEQLLKLANGRKEIVAEMIDIFLNTTPAEIHSLGKHISEKACDNAFRSAHRLKPSCKFMGLEKIVDGLEMLEEFCLDNNDWERIYNIYSDIKSHLELVYEHLKEKKAEYI